MVKISIQLLLSVLLSAGASAQQNKSKLYRGVYQLVMADEFNDTKLDSGNWITYYPYSEDGSDSCEFCRTHGKENQVYFDRNLVINDGVLNLIARREEAEWLGEKRPYTSGMIHSRQFFGKGRYEIKARVPEGNGLSPSIWTFGQISSEVDILEAGMQNPDRYHSTIHNWVLKKMVHRRIEPGVNISSDFHVYAMEWDNTEIRFYFDDRHVWTLCKYSRRNGKNPSKCRDNSKHKTIQKVFPAEGENLYLIINLGVGNEISAFTGEPDEKTVFPAVMQIDYVRIYKLAE